MSNPTDDGSDILADLLGPRARRSTEPAPAAPGSPPASSAPRPRSEASPSSEAAPARTPPPGGDGRTRTGTPPTGRTPSAADPDGDRRLADRRPDERRPAERSTAERPTAERRPAPSGPAERVVVHEHRRGRGCLVVLAILVVLALAAAGASLWVMKQVNPGGAGDEVAITIPEGTTTAGIAELLVSEGVVTNATIFEYYVKYRGDGTIQAGDYVLQESSSMGAALAVLEAGPQEPPYDQVTIPEGYSVWNGAGLPVPGPLVTALDEAVDRYTTESISEVLLSGEHRSRYLPADQGNLEGVLFPDTYRIDEDTTEAQVVQAMIDRFDQVAQELGYDDTESAVGLTPYETIIVASLVEREASLDEERAKVARVIYNRLAQGMTLGIDASTAYAVGGATNGTLTASQLETDSPYNTRINTGLPPTPIGLPGRASLEAALNPAEGDWLYYVLTSQDGSHTFTETYDEFLVAKEQCQALGLC